MKSPLPIEERSKRRREKWIIVISLLLVSLFTFLGYHIISNPEGISPFANLLIFAILDINIILILIVFFFIVRHVVKLFFEDRPDLLGKRLRTKLVIAFVSLSLVPTILLFWVSFQFLKTSLGYWFNIKIERALDESINLGQTYYQTRMSQVVMMGNNILWLVDRECGMDGMEEAPGCVENAAGLLIKEYKMDVPLNSILMTDNNGEVKFLNFWPPLDAHPDIPKDIIKRVVDSGEVITQGIDVDKGMYIMASLPIKDPLGNVISVLSVGSLIPKNMSRSLEEIRQGYEGYRQLLLYQTPIKGALLATLFLITLLIIFVSIWFGFRIAKGITEPVRKLTEATQRVAHGDLDFILQPHGSDELNSLLSAFNAMTEDLKEARGRAEEASGKLKKSYTELEQRGRYIEIILQNVAAGVISIDRRGVITTINKSAEEILSLSAKDMIGRSYMDILNKAQQEEFEQVRMELESPSRKTIYRPVRIVSGGKLLHLIANFTVLRDQEDRSQGVVVVFEDLTELEKIQRIAAWREVARRVAHEVKNPLTPIQLSAQRLRKRCMDKLDEDARKVFDGCTNTIIQQVEELKHLVNEFSSFARMPAPRFERVSLHEIIDGLLVMYRESQPHVKFSLMAEKNFPEIMLDKEQIKRALINMLDNAVTSMPEGGETTIELSRDMDKNQIRMVIADTGEGIPAEEKSLIFEPYFSRKKGGTGLGLPIVNSIVSDHNGRIEVEDNDGKGTRFIIFLPVNQG
jgi:two-component system nitrogen regulation sensor histidine kinase NtrY